MREMLLTTEVDNMLPEEHPFQLDPDFSERFNYTASFDAPGPELDWLLENLPGQLSVHFAGDIVRVLTNDSALAGLQFDAKIMPLEEFAMTLLAQP